ncbi:MAG: insulinase family protein [Planctomycetes bacterium]|nr:insulinase family protein [Planctomycetota bacterium]
MAQQRVEFRTLANGLTVIVETMPAVQSAAFSFLVPGGSCFDSPNHNGTAMALADWLSRGAGERSSRQVLAELDRLGIQSRESASTYHLAVSGSCLAGKLASSLRLYSDILLRPQLDDSEFESVTAGMENGLLSIEDDPQKKVMVELVRRCYPIPWGQPASGTLEDLPNLNPDLIRQHYQTTIRPEGAIFGIAGNVTLSDVLPVVEETFGGWSGVNPLKVDERPCGPKREHLEHESSQTHIGLAYPAVSYCDPDYYSAWAAVSVLSGGMSARLFTEVREKRGLCYSVYATLNTLKDRGQVLCYAGTTVERAQETLDVLRIELKRLGEGITSDELDRCKARAKSALIMAQESTGSRASSLSRNWFFLGRTLLLDEVHAKINALTVDTVLDYVHRRPADDFTIVTIGPNELE